MLLTFNYGSIMKSLKPYQIAIAKLQGSNGLGQHLHQMLVLLQVLHLF